MPVVAVGAAIWGGLSLATAAGTAAGIIMSFETIAAIGAVAAGVGVVTGNENLTKIGAVMGLVGGIGALANNAGMFAETAVASESVAASVTPPPTEGLLNSPPPQDFGSTAAPVAATPPVATPPVTGAVDPLAAAVDSANGVTGTVTKAGGFLEGVKDFVKPFTEFAKGNQMAAYGMINVGGALIGGMFDTTKDAQKKALEAQAAGNNAQTEILRQQQANMAAPVPTAIQAPRPSPFPTTPPPTYLQPNLVTGNVAQPGILNVVTGRNG